MPFSSRPREMDNNSINGRRSFRTFAEPRRAKPSGTTGNGGKGRVVPPESTSAENFYYLKQMSAKTPMVIVLTDGEEIRGWIEWYDRNCLKVNRENAPNLLIQKHCIKYLFKQEELG